MVKWQQAQVQHLTSSHSDHSPIIINQELINRESQQGNKPKPFRFEKMWTRTEECEQIIAEGWRCYPWDNDASSTISKIKRVLQLKPPSDQNVEKVRTVREELNEMLAREEILWKQRSRVHWLQKGDMNSKFFHERASVKKKKKRTQKLKDDNDEWQRDPQVIEQIANSYF